MPVLGTDARAPLPPRAAERGEGGRRGRGGGPKRRRALDYASARAVAASSVPPPPEQSLVWHLQLGDFAALASAVVYTDGSMIDGAPRFSGLCARLGWAFVLVDCHGALLAAASGQPPQWVRSVPGAESWALMQAATAFGDAPAYRVDCLALLQAYEQGFAKATASGSFFAEVWVQIRMAWDNNELVDLVWMPAHTSEADVGVLELSNRQLLSVVDRESNAEADRLAKAAADATRVHESV